MDHALAAPSLVGQIADVLEWHINADEPTVLDYNTDFKSTGQITSLYAPDAYRASDHDPVVVGLNLAPAVAGAPVPASDAAQNLVLVLLLGGGGVWMLWGLRRASIRSGSL